MLSSSKCGSFILFKTFKFYIETLRRLKWNWGGGRGLENLKEIMGGQLFGTPE